MREDVCRRELLVEALGGGIGGRCKWGAIDEGRNPRVRARRRNDRAAVRVPNENDWAADPLQSPFHVGHVLRVRVEPVLTRDHLVPLSEKGRDQFAEARAVGPQAVDEHDAGFALVRHGELLRQIAEETSLRFSGAGYVARGAAEASGSRARNACSAATT